MTRRNQIPAAARRYALSGDRTGIVDRVAQEHVATCANEAVASRIVFLLNIEAAGEVPSEKGKVMS